MRTMTLKMGTPIALQPDLGTTPETAIHGEIHRMQLIIELTRQDNLVDWFKFDGRMHGRTR
jgi:hypothetical protein